MRAEIICVGKDFVAGKSSSVTKYLSGFFSSAGIEVSRITVIPGNINSLVDIMNDVSARSKLVCIVGGQGAYDSNITNKALSKVLGLQLRFSRKALESISKYYAKQAIEVPTVSEKQADIPEGAEVLENSKGSTPALIIQNENNYFLIIPGSLKEVRSILSSDLHNRLKSRFESSIIKTAILHIFGLCGSVASSELEEIISREKVLEEGVVEFCFGDTCEGTDLTIHLKGRNELLMDELMHKLKNEVYTVMGDRIFGEGSDTLEAALGRRLASSRLTLSVAESCTGGLLSSRITDAPGSSLYFKQGSVVYSNKAKSNYLGISKDIINEKGAVSSEVALEMSDKIKSLAGSDYAIGVTGYAGPGVNDIDDPGRGYIAITNENNREVIEVRFSGSRKEVKEKFAASAMGFLWQRLKKT